MLSPSTNHYVPKIVIKSPDRQPLYHCPIPRGVLPFFSDSVTPINSWGRGQNEGTAVWREGGAPVFNHIRKEFVFWLKRVLRQRSSVFTSACYRLGSVTINRNVELKERFGTSLSRVENPKANGTKSPLSARPSATQKRETTAGEPVDDRHFPSIVGPFYASRPATQRPSSPDLPQLGDGASSMPPEQNRCVTHRRRCIRSKKL
ncbi:hypothetical protein GWI33_022360 [Rhynchophorus ferrugineus]|uniref:Uncharacterized protein n=1 Tax=Rhynchophorus ferrugineus TaxID=354439 RepID=A0A834HM83_RHYFE|nr:hypothetical protein GWI33_022362 [Rhynchophorus ferrugineus]KAF7264784.1 hypothetical protein GWI33_022360 [Rhynchophorus ferrugineus]